jgi:hypothetical protein
MATAAILGSCADGMACNRCGGSLIALEGSYNFSEERLIINLWSCIACGNQFETEALVLPHRWSEIDNRGLVATVIAGRVGTSDHSREARIN